MLDKVFTTRIYQQHRELLLSIIDSLIVGISFSFAYIVRSDFRLPDLSKISIPKYVFFMVVVIAVYNIGLKVLKVHKSLWSYIDGADSIRIFGVGVISVLILLPFVAISNFPHAYLSILVTGALISSILMYGMRVAYGIYRLNQSRSRGVHRRALIIGAGASGYMLLNELTQNDTMKVEVVGFVDDFKVGNMIAGYKVLGDTNQLQQLVSKYHIEELYIAMLSASKKDLMRIFDLCQECHITTKIMKHTSDRLEDEIDGSKKSIPIEDISIEDLLGRGEVHLEQHEIASYLENHVVLVSGAGGSIGSELCRAIMKFHPKKLLMLDINENSLYMLEQEFLRKKRHREVEDIEMVSIITSIRDEKSLDDVFTTYKPEVVFHAAAHKHVPLMETRPKEAIKNNVFGTQHVIQCCIKHNVGYLIMISTDKAVNPANIMGASKRMTEMLLQAYGKNCMTKMAAVRFGNVLGSNGSVIPIFQKQIADGGPVTITDKNIIRYFMTIPEAAQLVLQAGYYADKGEIFVLDMGEPVKIIDLAEKMIRMAGLVPYKDIDIVEIGLRPGEKMYEELRLDGEECSRTKNNLIFKNQVMDISIQHVENMLKTLQQKLECQEDELREYVFQVIRGEE